MVLLYYHLAPLLKVRIPLSFGTHSRLFEKKRRFPFLFLSSFRRSISCLVPKDQRFCTLLSVSFFDAFRQFLSNRAPPVSFGTFGRFSGQHQVCRQYYWATPSNCLPRRQRASCRDKL